MFSRATDITMGTVSIAPNVPELCKSSSIRRIYIHSYTLLASYYEVYGLGSSALRSKKPVDSYAAKTISMSEQKYAPTAQFSGFFK